MKKNFWLVVIICVSLTSTIFGQSERKLIENSLMNYIEGTSYNYTERIQKAFHQDANLYLNGKNDALKIVPSKEYISWFKSENAGKFTGRIGEIISIDIEGNIASAKAEILIPSKEIRFVDIFLMRKNEGEWQIISKTATSKPSNRHGNRILFILSNAHFHGKSKLPTGNSFAEIVNAYHTFKEAGYTVDFVSPKGGAVPLAYVNTSAPLEKKYIYNPDFMANLQNTKTPQEIKPKNYKAVHYVGGGSAMYGVPESKEIQAISMEIYEKYQGIVSSVCHGTAGIVNLKTKDGKYLVSGKKVNGYPDSFERQDAEYFKQFPFKIQKTIEERGGDFQFSKRNNSHLEIDGRLVTGQNYLSSELVASKIIEMLKEEIK